MTTSEGSSPSQNLVNPVRQHSQALRKFLRSPAGRALMELVREWRRRWASIRDNPSTRRTKEVYLAAGICSELDQFLELEAQVGKWIEEDTHPEPKGPEADEAPTEIRWTSELPTEQ